MVVVALGEVHVFKELKLALVSVKWRLQQRQRALTASKIIIDKLRGRLTEADTKLQEKTTEVGTSNTFRMITTTSTSLMYSIVCSSQGRCIAGRERITASRTG